MTQKIWHFPKAIMKRSPQVFANTRRNVLFDLVSYVIDSKFRKSKFLTNWIRNCVNEALNDEEFVDIADSIKKGPSDDETMLNCLKWVINNIDYVGDYKKWGMEEKWDTPLELIYNKKGDCEDGHILLYALARAKGISADKMFLWCGDVQTSATAPTGGHCSLLYKPLEYPLNFVWMDWCYNASLQPVFNRKLIFLNGKLIEEFVSSIAHGWMNKFSCYKKTWFVFNESFSTNYYSYKKKK